jgi:hypothetical protein
VSPSLSSIPDDWRVPLLLGAASLPFTIASYQQSGSTMSLSAVVFAGVVAGFWTGGADRVGARTGLVGGLAVLRVLAEMVTILPELTGPWWFLVVAAVGSVVFASLGLGLSVLLGELGGRVGGWLARRTGRSEAAVTG